MQSGDEDTKSGVPQIEVDEMLAFIDAECPRLKFKGFMAMGKLNDRDGFKQVKALAERI